MKNLHIGTCSWKYDSWVGLVYSQEFRTSGQYLAEYAKKYRSVEIDSWFYKIPSEKDVLEYREAVDPDFTFTCKVPQALTLTNLRDKSSTKNPDFLSIELFDAFLDRVSPLLPQIQGLIFEFEYLNKQKMASLDTFLEALDLFIAKAPKEIPVAIETRNKNYLTDAYFDFLQAHNLIHVLTEKQYMPSIIEVYENHKDQLTDTVIIRLLGGDRADIEKKTQEQWNTIVDEKPDKPQIVSIIKHMLAKGKKVILNVNNHYEGSAPLTIISLLELMNK